MVDPNKNASTITKKNTIPKIVTQPIRRSPKMKKLTKK